MHRARSIAELSDTGRQEHVSLRMQVLPDTGVIVPGQFVRYVGDRTRRGDRAAHSDRLELAYAAADVGGRDPCCIAPAGAFSRPDPGRSSAGRRRGGRHG
ncbi:hypothetical protein GO496_10765 [Acidovorax citrulli]|nr:hypothetical protein [Paracidovorax citrulli]